jgi:hypothetical protein
MDDWEKIEKMVPEEVILPLSQCCGKPVIRGHCVGCLKPILTLTGEEKQIIKDVLERSDKDHTKPWM